MAWFDLNNTDYLTAFKNFGVGPSTDLVYGDRSMGGSSMAIPGWMPSAGVPTSNELPPLRWDQEIGLTSSRNGAGWGGLALNALGGLAQGYLAMKQYGLAEEALENNKAQFAMNYDAQRRTTNAALEDRQRSRIASNPGAYESLQDYMNKNRIQ